MGDSDDIFDDFDSKVRGREEVHIRHHEDNEKEFLNKRYLDEMESLKHEYQEEMKTIEQRDTGETLSKGERKTGLGKVERFTYIGILIILFGYLVTDLSFFHGEKGIGLFGKQEITTSVVKEANQSVGVIEVVREKAEEPEVEEGPKLSGTISLTIDKIYTEIDDNDNDIGYISKLVFTINNGENKVLTPLVNVFIYDDELDEIWETKIRGQFIYMDGIDPGGEFTADIDLVPKTYRNLNLKKHIRVALNDTEDGFVTAVNDAIIIS